jgi:hypothetical protein
VQFDAEVVMWAMMWVVMWAMMRAVMWAGKPRPYNAVNVRFAAVV